MSWFEAFRAGPRVPRIAPVRSQHAERLAAIHASAFARPWGPEEFEAFVTDRAIQADGLFLGRSPEPAGFALSRIVLDEAEVLSVALTRSARGLGHSRLLLSCHLQNLAHAGVARVHLEVEDGNLPALALYRRLGFVRCGTRPDYYARPDGTRAAAQSMTRVLSDRSPATARP